MALTQSKPLTALVGRDNARRLHDAGVRDLAWLLRIARTREGRQQLALSTGLREDDLLQWANFADLQRIPGVGADGATGLQQVGVRGVRDLVASDLRSLSAAFRGLGRDPRPVASWLREARKVRPAVRENTPPQGQPWGPGEAGDAVDRVESLEDPSARFSPRGRI